MQRHRKATDVAAELGLTQSGVSQALKRLCDIFGDPLFLRRPHGMDPTAIALALEATVAAAQATGALVTLPSPVNLTFAPAFGLVAATPPVAIRGFTIATQGWPGCGRRGRPRFNPKAVASPRAG